MNFLMMPRTGYASSMHRPKTLLTPPQHRTCSEQWKGNKSNCQKIFQTIYQVLCTYLRKKFQNEDSSDSLLNVFIFGYCTVEHPRWKLYLAPLRDQPARGMPAITETRFDGVQKELLNEIRIFQDVLAYLETKYEAQTKSEVSSLLSLFFDLLSSCLSLLFV